MRWGFAFVLVSCASTSTGIAPSAPSPAQTTWLADALGARPDASFFVRPAALAADPYWGPLVARALSGHAEWRRLADARQIDVHIAVRDPLFLVKRKSDSAVVGWIAIAYGASDRPDAGALPGPSFVASDGTFVATDSFSANRVGAAVARGDLPRPLDVAPDSLAGVTFGVTSMRFFGKNGDLFRGMTAVGYGLRGGTNGALEGYADYASSDDADRAYASFEQTCVEKTNGCILPPMWFRDAKAVQHGRRITVTLVFSEALLQSLGELAR